MHPALTILIPKLSLPLALHKKPLLLRTIGKVKGALAFLAGVAPLANVRGARGVHYLDLTVEEAIEEEALLNLPVAPHFLCEAANITGVGLLGRACARETELGIHVHDGLARVDDVA